MEIDFQNHIYNYFPIKLDIIMYFFVNFGYGINYSDTIDEKC